MAENNIDVEKQSEMDKEKNKENSNKKSHKISVITILSIILAVAFVVSLLLPKYGEQALTNYLVRSIVWILAGILLVSFEFVLRARNVKKGKENQELGFTKLILLCVYAVFAILGAHNLMLAVKDLNQGEVQVELFNCESWAKTTGAKYRSTHYYIKGTRNNQNENVGNSNKETMQFELKGIDYGLWQTLEKGRTDVTIIYYPNTKVVKEIQIINSYYEEPQDLVNYASEHLEELTAEDMESEFKDGDVYLRKAANDTLHPIDMESDSTEIHDYSVDDMVHVYYKDEIVTVEMFNYDVLVDMKATVSDKDEEIDGIDYIEMTLYFTNDREEVIIYTKSSEKDGWITSEQE